MKDLCTYMAENGKSFWGGFKDLDKRLCHGLYIQTNVKCGSILTPGDVTVSMSIHNRELNEDVPYPSI